MYSYRSFVRACAHRDDSSTGPRLVVLGNGVEVGLAGLGKGAISDGRPVPGEAISLGHRVSNDSGVVLEEVDDVVDVLVDLALVLDGVKAVNVVDASKLTSVRSQPRSVDDVPR